MPTTHPPALLIPSEALLLRYEEMRRGALAGAGVGPLGNGAVVLLRQGMAAWMHAWSEEGLRRSATVPQSGPPVQRHLLAGVVEPEVVVVLAQMVLQASKES